MLDDTQKLLDAAMKKNLVFLKGLSPEAWQKDKAKAIATAGATLALLEVKKEDAELVRQIKELVFSAVQLNVPPASLRNFFVGLDRTVYWTLPDLVIGNRLFFSEVDNFYSFPSTAGTENRELMNRAFYFPEKNAVLEIFGDAKDKSKRVMSESIFTKINGLVYQCLNTESFFQKGVFDHDGWIHCVHGALALIGVDLGLIPESSKACLNEDVEIIDWYTKAFLYQLRTDQ